MICTRRTLGGPYPSLYQSRGFIFNNNSTPGFFKHYVLAQIIPPLHVYKTMDDFGLLNEQFNTCLVKWNFGNGCFHLSCICGDYNIVFYTLK